MENSDNPALNASYSYSYSLTGAKAGMTGGGTDTTYGYDDLGRIIKETSSDGSEKQYSYDAADNRTSLLIKVNGASYVNTTYSYDRLNRLTTVQENGAPVASYTYYDNGNRASLSYASGNLTDYEYNLANRLTRLTNRQGTDVLSEYVYTYYLDGNQSSKTDHTGQVTEYIYDDLGRLIGEARGGEPGVTYTYDDSNNRASLTVADGPVTSYAYDRNNRLLTETKVMGDVTEIARYSYDRNGNEICRTSEVVEPQADLAEEFSLSVSGVDEESSAVAFHYYDGFNQLAKTTIGDQSIIYGYNGDGLRTSKQVNGITTIHVWDGNQIALELNDAGQVTGKYVRGTNLIYAEGGVAQSFYLFNGHGDVVQLTGSDGSVIRSYDYDAFGNEVDPDPADSNVFGYCGEYFDRETGTYYLRARYYDPVIGRFITEDSCQGNPEKPSTWHLYTYVSNNPLRYIDPTGHAEVELWEEEQALRNGVGGGGGGGVAKPSSPIKIQPSGRFVPSTPPVSISGAGGGGGNMAWPSREEPKIEEKEPLALWREVIDHAEPVVGRSGAVRYEATLDGGAKAVIRWDSHPLAKAGYNDPVNHWNIEIQVPTQDPKRPHWISDDLGPASHSRFLWVVCGLFDHTEGSGLGHFRSSKGDGNVGMSISGSEALDMVWSLQLVGLRRSSRDVVYVDAEAVFWIMTFDQSNGWLLLSEADPDALIELSPLREYSSLPFDPLLFRRLLPGKYGDAIWERLAKGWQVTGDLYYPLRKCSRHDLLAFDASPFEHEALEKVVRYFGSLGLTYVLELREDGPVYLTPVSELYLVDHFQGEAFWASEQMDWIIYLSHENTITLGGQGLIGSITQSWSDWNRWTYPG